MRRSLVVLVALLCPLGLLAACGDDDDGGAVGSSTGDTSGSGSGSGDVATTAPDATTVETTPGGARVVNPTPGLNGVNETALDSVVSQPNNKLEVRFYGGVVDCYGVDHIDVEEADDAVTITVYTGTPPAAAATSCIDIAELQAVIVALASPLGERHIIDGSSGAEVPLS
jgi:hypothetical protein